ncbi:MAG: hypothetical protein QOK21_3573 [Solirubrobacteraceae bacterium]|jgi:hypothetical protein|nr:hypothetical protein [Solirubrobacteraceae bacterium]
MSKTPVALLGAAAAIAAAIAAQAPEIRRYLKIRSM